jgi:DNA-binding response OmpR family regulator
VFKVLLADKNVDRAEKLADELNKCGFSAAVIEPSSKSIKPYIKRHEPDALVIIHSFSEKKILSLINQAKKNDVLTVVTVSRESLCSRLIKVLADEVIEVEDYSNFCKGYLNIIEEKLSYLKHENSKDKCVSYGMFFADTEKNIVYYGKKRLNLTPTEFQLMVLLILNGGNLVSKNEIMKQIWGTPVLKSNSLNVHLQRLRNEIRKVTKKYLIETVKGKGYRLVKLP